MGPNRGRVLSELSRFQGGWHERAGDDPLMLELAQAGLVTFLTHQDRSWWGPTRAGLECAERFEEQARGDRGAGPA